MFTTEQRQLGQSKLPNQTIDLARDGETYALLESELNKLVDLHSSEAVDWKKISHLAQQFLENEGKDINVGTWLAVAWANCYQASGLAAGIEVLNDLHQHYWDDMTPPLKRLRARRNQMQWFIDQIMRLIELQESPWTLAAADYEPALENSKALDLFWREHDDEAPALYRLVTLLQTMQPETEVEVEVEPEVETKAVAVAEAEAEIKPTINKQPEAKTIKVIDKTPALSHAELAALETPAPKDSSQLEKNIDLVFSTLMKSLGDLPDPLLNEPLLYRLNRVAAWMTIEQAPPSQDGSTRLAPPSATDIETLARLEQGQDQLALLRFIESRVFSCRYWLDLQYIAYQAAMKLPNGQLIANTIRAETDVLIQRIPELIQLHYQDGLPFANEQTKAWLSMATTTQSKVIENLPGLNQNNSATVVALIAAAQAEAQIAKNALIDLEQRLAKGLDQYINVI